jgi:hypothetical protein
MPKPPPKPAPKPHEEAGPPWTLGLLLVGAFLIYQAVNWLFSEFWQRGIAFTVSVLALVLLQQWYVRHLREKG